MNIFNGTAHDIDIIDIKNTEYCKENRKFHCNSKPIIKETIPKNMLLSVEVARDYGGLLAQDFQMTSRRL